MKPLIACLALFVSTAVGIAEPIVIVVRHAEKDTAGGADPALSAAGRARAETLARLVAQAGIARVFTSEFKRTQQTAAPVVEALHITPKVVAGKDVAALVSQLRNGQGNALVIGHSDTVPALLRALGLDQPVTIADQDYGDIFVVILEEKPQLLHLRYP
jgi:broad specificity phosphatase PhoE